MSITYTIRNRLEDDLVYFTNFSLIEELGINASFFDNNCNLDRKHLYGQYTDIEKNFLFNFIRKIKPKNIIEFSPCYGYTTAVINSALKSENVNFDFFQTYELDPDCVEGTKENLASLGFSDIEVIEGDVLKCMDLEKLKKCDLLFVDCEHSTEFAKKYVDKFFGLLPEGAWVTIHDIVFSTKNEETKIIEDFIKENNIKDYFYLPDVLKRLKVKDFSLNILGSGNREYSTSLWFRV